MNNCKSCFSRTCPNGHGLIIRSCDCCKGTLFNVVFSCVPCNYLLCGNCAGTHTHGSGSISSNVSIKVENTVKEEKKKPSSPCHQCGGEIVYNRVDRSKRIPKCTECKGSDFEHVFTCFTCNLDVCEPCALKVTGDMMGMMSNMMSGFGGPSNKGGFSQGGNNQPPRQQAPPQKGGFSSQMAGMMGGFGFK